MISLLPLGSTSEIGATCFYLNISGTGILLDCGIDPKKKGIESIPAFELLENLPLDFVFISHAHQDHIGALPFLVQKFPFVIIYSTVQTKEIAEVTLHNAANILAQDADQNNNLKIYTHEEIDLLVRSIRGIEYEESIELKGMRHRSEEPIIITFYDAGHILGSASILIEFSGRRILFTGDINLSDQSIMIHADLKGIKKVDLLMLETTYGFTDSAILGTWETEKDRLIKSANEILHKGGSVLIPVFALGKTQELLALLYERMMKGKLTETGIYTGGVGREISALYDRNRFITRRKEKNLVLKEIPQQNIFEVEDYNFFLKNPSIVLVSSGMMLPGTTSFKLLDYWINQKDFAVFGVGYMDDSTPGYRLMNSSRGSEIRLTDFSSPKKVKCLVKRFYFPSHARREDLLKIVDAVNPDRVFLIHGEKESVDWVGHYILRKFDRISVNTLSKGNIISV